jgi:preprotein translocase subunit SecD
MPDRRSLVIVSAILAVTVLAIAAIVLVMERARVRTTMTVEAERSDGSGVPDANAMRATERVLLARLTAAGMQHGTIEVKGDRLVVRVDDRPEQRVLRALAEPGVVRMRRVLASTPDAVPDAARANMGGPATTRDAVIAKIGPGYEAVAKQAATQPDPLVLDASTQAVLAPFATLSPDEVALLPAAVQYAVPTIRCQQLERRPPGVLNAAREQVVVCLDDAKLRLDAAAVDDRDIKSAFAHENGMGTWSVDVRFTEDGQGRFTQLSRDAVAHPDHRQVAILVDDALVDTPAVITVMPSDMEIAGLADAATARGLAGKMTGGALPVRLTVVSIS